MLVGTHLWFNGLKYFPKENYYFSKLASLRDIKLFFLQQLQKLSSIWFKNVTIAFLTPETIWVFLPTGQSVQISVPTQLRTIKKLSLFTKMLLKCLWDAPSMKYELIHCAALVSMKLFGMLCVSICIVWKKEWAA